MKPETETALEQEQETQNQIDVPGPQPPYTAYISTRCLQWEHGAEWMIGREVHIMEHYFEDGVLFAVLEMHDPVNTKLTLIVPHKILVLTNAEVDVG